MSALDTISRLRSILQKFPRFAYAHRKLAEKALEADDVATAYASAHALVVLKGETAITHYLFGRCFIKRGSYDKAVWHLEMAKEKRPGSSEIKEELAAAYVFQKRFTEAREIIFKINEKRLSQHGLQLREYLKSRGEGDGGV